MGRRAKGLSAAFVSKAKPGRYGDGDGLYLLVRDAEAKFWVWRYVRDRKMREKGLGPVRLKALAEAREEARELMKAHRAGRDPLVDEAKASAAAKTAAARSKTFRDAATAYIEEHKAGWKNAKHAQQWENTLETYVHPVIGATACSEVTTEDVLEILRPLWRAKKVETGSRVRGRIEMVLDYAKLHKWRDGENPARWKGHLDHVFPAKSKVRKVKNHPAVPIDDLPAVFAKLSAAEGIAAAATAFCILTASRPGNVAKAQWSQIDLDKAMWSMMDVEIKTDVPHRLPLSKPAIAILKRMAVLRRDDFIFPGGVIGSPLSLTAMSKALASADGAATVHGTARSTFDDWATERTRYSPKLVDLALAHRERNKTTAAYRRTDMLEQRKPLMEDWGTFLTTPPVERGKVVKLRGQ